MKYLSIEQMTPEPYRLITVRMLLVFSNLSWLYSAADCIYFCLTYSIVIKYTGLHFSEVTDRLFIINYIR